MITYDITEEPYRHWVLTIDPPVATLTLGDGDEDSGSLLPSLLRPDIELADALQCLRFAHPEVTLVVVTFSTELPEIPSAAPAGVAANIRAFRHDLHAAIKDASANSGLHSLTVLNGPVSGPGYELALATDEIVLLDSGRSLADVVGERARAAAGSARGPAAEAVAFGPLWREEFDGGFAYPNVRVDLDAAAGEAVVTIVGPPNHECFVPEPGPKRLRSRWWPLAVCRELDDALLMLRSDWPADGSLVLRTEGDPLAVASADVALTSGCEHDWFVREVVLYWKRMLRRLDLVSQSVIALVEPGSCFVGTLLELAFAADRISMVDSPATADSNGPTAEILLTGMNFGPLPQASGLTRLESRFSTRHDHLAALALRVGDPIAAPEAAELGLVTEAIQA